MRVRHGEPPDQRDLLVEVDDPDATVADLCEALEPNRPAGPLLIDGRRVPAATPIDRAGITDGAVLRRAPPGPDQPPAADDAGPALLAITTTGPDGGRRFRLGPGAHVVGRTGGAAPVDVPIDDPTVSARHARLDVSDDLAVRVTDLGSTNGTWLGAEPVTATTVLPPGTAVRFGATHLSIGTATSAPDADADASLRAVRTHHGPGGGTRPMHRPPRRLPSEGAGPLEAPDAPEPPSAAAPVGVIAVLASLAVGGAMVVVLGSWTYALFSLLGPVLVVAGALDGRRRRRRARRRGSRRRRAELARFAEALADRAALEVAFRDDRYAGIHRSWAIAAGPGTRCWERRPAHPDAYEVRLGLGTAPWSAPVTGADAAVAAPDLAAILDRHRSLVGAPIGLRLEPGRPVAIVGPPEVTRALVRSTLVQAAVAHGPVDLRVALLAGPDRGAAWDWCAWLPHARTAEHGSLLAGTADAASRLAADVAPPTDERASADRGAPVRTIVVVDDPPSLAARRSPARSVLRASLDADRGIVPLVLVEDADAVPAACATVLAVTADGRLQGPPDLVRGAGTFVGTSVGVATDVARALARWDDPEVDDAARGLPGAVRLTSLLGADRLTRPGIAARWRSAGADPPPRALLGVAADGPLVVDLATDGPHALVAGTTGSGKSELLRTLVASLAAGCSPDHLTFVLIDFKGGSAFDACARLPHTTGLVTDLDDHLAARALRCLDAELRHRERRLRAAGAPDLAALRCLPDEAPLPRLVVVVDEFATLAAELPDFVDALVGVAQRGRSLGVHLVLATQRPSGAVSESIRANTALRVALRVQSSADSVDVIDVADAARLGRSHPGRALVRLGPGELAAVQVAHVSGPVAEPGSERPPAAVRVRPLAVPCDPVGGDLSGRPGAPAPSARGRPTELDVLVDEVAEAWRAGGGTPPRRPWPEPLATEVAWPLAAEGDASSVGPALLLGVADDPDHQRQAGFEWRPDDGPLLVAGLPGSGATTTAATVVLAAAARWTADECHVHVVDLGAGDLRPLAGLPHVGAVVAADDRERQRRLLAELADDLARRRAAGAAARRGGARSAGAVDPRRILVVDGLTALRSRWDDLEPSGTWEHFVEVVRTGAEVGIGVVVTVDGPSSAPHHVVAACRQRLVLRLGDRADHAAFGVPAAAVPALPPGRGVAVEGTRLVQVARPPEGLGAAVARLAGAAAPTAPRPPRPVGVLPTAIGLPCAAGSSPAGRWSDDGAAALVVGVADAGLGPARLLLAPGAHALVAGPPRSGRTTALATLAEAARAAGARVVVVVAGVAEHPWPNGAVVLDAEDPALATAIEVPGPLLVLVDDADRTVEDHPVLAATVARRRADRHVVAAGRSEHLRGAYGHWTREVRADRCGLLLVPDLDLDGDLLAARLPRRAPIGLHAGRAWLGGGEPDGFVQVARPGLAAPGPIAPHIA